MPPGMRYRQRILVAVETVQNLLVFVERTESSEALWAHLSSEEFQNSHASRDTALTVLD